MTVSPSVTNVTLGPYALGSVEIHARPFLATDEAGGTQHIRQRDERKEESWRLLFPEATDDSIAMFDDLYEQTGGGVRLVDFDPGDGAGSRQCFVDFGDAGIHTQRNALRGSFSLVLIAVK